MATASIDPRVALATPARFAAACDPRWEPKRHLTYVGESVARAIARPGGRLIVNLPPSHGKSQLISKWTPAWFLSLAPDLSVIHSSYEQGVSTDWGRRARHLVGTLGFTTLSQQVATQKQWETEQGGGMVCAGVGGPITGRHGDLLIVDDPHKNWEEAQSSTYRRKAAEWFESVLYSRQKPGATIIVLMTRWHTADLTGYLLNKHPDEWEHIRLPALAEEGDPISRPEGEPLVPEWFSERDFKGAQGSPRVWSAIYQQDPRFGGHGRMWHRFGDHNIDKSVKLETHLPLCVSFDWNINPGMHALIGQYDHKRDEGRITHLIHAPRMTVKECLRAIDELIEQMGGWQWPRLELFGDATKDTAAATGRASVHQVLSWARQKRRFRNRIPGKNPDVAISSEALNVALKDEQGEPHWKIHPRCETLLTDLAEQPEDEDGRPDKSDELIGHASDCLRYMNWRMRPLRMDQPSGQARFGVSTRK